MQADGSLGSAPQIISHFGELGPNAGRQEAPHPNMVLPDSTGNFVLVNDLGLDAAIVYSFDSAPAKTTEVNRVPSPTPSGPRHLSRHPSRMALSSVNHNANTSN